MGKARRSSKKVNRPAEAQFDPLVERGTLYRLKCEGIVLPTDEELDAALAKAGFPTSKDTNSEMIKRQRALAKND